MVMIMLVEQREAHQSIRHRHWEVGRGSKLPVVVRYTMKLVVKVGIRRSAVLLLAYFSLFSLTEYYSTILNNPKFTIPPTSRS